MFVLPDDRIGGWRGGAARANDRQWDRCTAGDVLPGEFVTIDDDTFLVRT